MKPSPSESEGDATVGTNTAAMNNDINNTDNESDEMMMMTGDINDDNNYTKLGRDDDVASSTTSADASESHASTSRGAVEASDNDKSNKDGKHGSFASATEADNGTRDADDVDEATNGGDDLDDGDDVSVDYAAKSEVCEEDGNNGDGENVLHEKEVEDEYNSDDEEAEIEIDPDMAISDAKMSDEEDAEDFARMQGGDANVKDNNSNSNSDEESIASMVDNKGEEESKNSDDDEISIDSSVANADVEFNAHGEDDDEGGGNNNVMVCREVQKGKTSISSASNDECEQAADNVQQKQQKSSHDKYNKSNNGNNNNNSNHGNHPQRSSITKKHIGKGTGISRKQIKCKNCSRMISVYGYYQHSKSCGVDHHHDVPAAADGSASAGGHGNIAMDESGNVHGGTDNITAISTPTTSTIKKEKQSGKNSRNNNNNSKNYSKYDQPSHKPRLRKCTNCKFWIPVPDFYMHSEVCGEGATFTTFASRKGGEDDNEDDSSDSIRENDEEDDNQSEDSGESNHRNNKKFVMQQHEFSEHEMKQCPYCAEWYHWRGMASHLTRCEREAALKADSDDGNGDSDAKDAEEEEASPKRQKQKQWQLKQSSSEEKEYHQKQTTPSKQLEVKGQHPKHRSPSNQQQQKQQQHQQQKTPSRPSSSEHASKDHDTTSLKKQCPNCKRWCFYQGFAMHWRSCGEGLELGEVKVVKVEVDGQEEEERKEGDSNGDDLYGESGMEMEEQDAVSVEEESSEEDLGEEGKEDDNGKEELEEVEDNSNCADDLGGHADGHEGGDLYVCCSNCSKWFHRQGYPRHRDACVTKNKEKAGGENKSSRSDNADVSDDQKRNGSEQETNEGLEKIPFSSLEKGRVVKELSRAVFEDAQGFGRYNNQIKKNRQYINENDPRPCMGCPWCGPKIKEEDEDVIPVSMCTICKRLRDKGWVVRYFQGATRFVDEKGRHYNSIKNYLRDSSKMIFSSPKGLEYIGITGSLPDPKDSPDPKEELSDEDAARESSRPKRREMIMPKINHDDAPKSKEEQLDYGVKKESSLSKKRKFNAPKANNVDAPEPRGKQPDAYVIEESPKRRKSDALKFNNIDSPNCSQHASTMMNKRKAFVCDTDLRPCLDCGWCGTPSWSPSVDSLPSASSPKIDSVKICPTCQWLKDNDEWRSKAIKNSRYFSSVKRQLKVKSVKDFLIRTTKAVEKRMKDVDFAEGLSKLTDLWNERVNIEAAASKPTKSSFKRAKVAVAPPESPHVSPIVPKVVSDAAAAPAAVATVETNQAQTSGTENGSEDTPPSNNITTDQASFDCIAEDRRVIELPTVSQLLKKEEGLMGVLREDVFHVYNTHFGTNANIAAKILLSLCKGDIPSMVSDETPFLRPVSQQLEIPPDHVGPTPIQYVGVYRSSASQEDHNYSVAIPQFYVDSCSSRYQNNATNGVTPFYKHNGYVIPRESTVNGRLLLLRAGLDDEEMAGKFFVFLYRIMYGSKAVDHVLVDYAQAKEDNA